MAGDQPLGDAAMVGNVRARCEDREEGAVEVGDAGDERRRSGSAREVLLDSVTVARTSTRLNSSPYCASRIPSSPSHHPFFLFSLSFSFFFFFFFLFSFF